MKLMIASDIHGSGYFCEKLFEAYDREIPDRLLLLGDLLYHGPRNDLPRDYAPKLVAQMLNDHAQKLLCVRGNCEAEVDQMMLSFPVLADYNVLFVEDHTFYATHGHVYNEKTPLPLADGDVLLCGHTHVPRVAECGNFVYLNPGSVSIPKEGSANSYMIYEDGVFSWKDLDGMCYKKYKL